MILFWLSPRGTFQCSLGLCLGLKLNVIKLALVRLTCLINITYLLTYVLNGLVNITGACTRSQT